MVKGLLLAVVSALQLPNNLRVLVKPERKELQFSIFSLLCLITLTILPLVNLILSKATKHLVLLVFKFAKNRIATLQTYCIDCEALQIKDHDLPNILYWIYIVSKNSKNNNSIQIKH